MPETFAEAQRISQQPLRQAQPQPQLRMTEFILKLTAEQLQHVGSGLDMLPHGQVRSTVDAIQQQLLQAAEKAREDHQKLQTQRLQQEAATAPPKEGVSDAVPQTGGQSGPGSVG